MSEPRLQPNSQASHGNAIRQRRHRERRKAGKLVVPVEVNEGHLSGLVWAGFLGELEADKSAIGAAIAAHLNETLSSKKSVTRYADKSRGEVKFQRTIREVNND